MSFPCVVCKREVDVYITIIVNVRGVSGHICQHCYARLQKERD